MSKRRTYSAEYKQEAVSLAESSDRSISQVARDLGINANLLGRWRREAEADGGQAFRGSGVSRDEELTAMKRELVRVRKERDFLKEAAVDSMDQCNTLYSHFEWEGVSDGASGSSRDVSRAKSRSLAAMEEGGIVK